MLAVVTSSCWVEKRGLTLYKKLIDYLDNMKITIEFDTENAAFEDDRFGEVSRILKNANKRVMDCLEDGGGIRVPIKDINGNRAGILEVVM